MREVSLSFPPHNTNNQILSIFKWEFLYICNSCVFEKKWIISEKIGLFCQYQDIIIFIVIVLFKELFSITTYILQPHRRICFLLQTFFFFFKLNITTAFKSSVIVAKLQKIEHNDLFCFSFFFGGIDRALKCAGGQPCGWDDGVPNTTLH